MESNECNSNYYIYRYVFVIIYKYLTDDKCICRFSMHVVRIVHNFLDRLS
ncbi:hypothetical protein QJS10_CPB04g00812 [Acorus calamus]|uniref:Uncharacterized protein n=1 Tax=Acorus calamus TaxID=4465 RepID=A0AAV9F2Z4_ACOCL|nr:hypothetical protein QJS10_CPB04g00812 [Acorus calamus]